ncbi:hypothetical protein [Streptomyces sp. NPDC004330]|uniref:hypothetical protein n=1 Tax=Streptomyces sp. NPDC004330 TaxID=3364700 RepID=UPI0036A2D1DF
MTSERDRLADLIRSFSGMCTRVEALAEVDRFEKFIAHELAEKIRADVGPRDCHCNGLCGGGWARTLRLRDADLIEDDIDTLSAARQRRRDTC